MVVTSSLVGSRSKNKLSLTTWSQAVLLLLVAVGTYFQSWIDVWPYWHGENGWYDHGPLVVLVAMWLAWRERSTVNQLKPLPSIWACPVMLCLSAIWVLAESASLFIIHAALWPILALGMLWVGLGFQIASRFALSLGYLYFAIPVWAHLQAPLQLITSAMVGLLTHASGVSAAIDGPYITLPTGQIFIAQGCSGSVFLCISLAVGVLASIMRNDDLRTRLLVLLIAGLVSMVFNWLRIFLIVLAHLNPDLKELERANHILFGWSVFALGLVVFFLILRFLPDSAREQTGKEPSNTTNPMRRNSSSGFAFAIIAAVIVPAVTWVLPRFDAYPSQPPGADLGLSAIEEYAVAPDLYWQPHFPGAIWEERFAIATTGGVVIEAYGNRYHEQSQGSELISHTSHLFDTLRFDSTSSTVVDLSDSQGLPIRARREVLSLLSKPGSSWLTYYAYFVGREPVTNARRTQLLSAFRSLYSRDATGVIAVAVPCIDACTAKILDVEDAFIRAFEANRDMSSE